MPAASACSLKSGLQGSECDLCLESLEEEGFGDSGTSTHIFEAVQILVALAASLAMEGLLLLHALGARIRSTSLWVDDGERPVTVFV
jgi:hypothetical protein